ncbi:tyrosine-protein phosphatase [Acidiphilium sp. PA]|uniref:tyrosine-protein phosphatase n=1 Tax=Acidiphilium sp. PA TaxID=2871705 RepID=UPI0022445BE5|nr:tyrosine-protein phosphatase [Acidiphilium sp. PA]MCW8305472.1 tyrosine-protein phosphatase [Acidiphilium sp. PA]
MSLLAGAPNFRAVDPLPAGGGRRLRPGLIYRSGALASLTRDDTAAIEPLGIKLICDLRSASERRRFPTVWPALAPARTIAMPAESDREAGMQPLIDRLAREPGPDGARRAMLDLYGSLPRLLAPVLQAALAAAASGWGIPILLHCHVGKDRTGVAVALILTALGIERAAITTDYQETANRIDIAVETRHFARTLGMVLGRAIDPGTLDQLGRTDPAYLAAAFGAIDQIWGGPAGYFDAIGISASGRERLQALFLD